MNNDNKSDQFFLTIVSLVFVCAMWQRFGHELGQIFAKNKYLVAGLVTVTTVSAWVLIRKKLTDVFEERRFRRTLFKSREPDSLRVGKSKSGETVFVPLSARRMHTQVVGTTNAGKTESVIVPWAISDIEAGRGLILIDGKSDRKPFNPQSLAISPDSRSSIWTER